MRKTLSSNISTLETLPGKRGMFYFSVFCSGSSMVGAA